MTGGTHLSYVFNACLQRAFMLASWREETPASFNSPRYGHQGALPSPPINPPTQPWPFAPISTSSSPPGRPRTTPATAGARRRQGHLPAYPGRYSLPFLFCSVPHPVAHLVNPFVCTLCLQVVAFFVNPATPPQNAAPASNPQRQGQPQPHPLRQQARLHLPNIHVHRVPF